MWRNLSVYGGKIFSLQIMVAALVIVVMRGTGIEVLFTIGSDKVHGLLEQE